MFSSTSHSPARLRSHPLRLSSSPRQQTFLALGFSPPGAHRLRRGEQPHHPLPLRGLPCCPSCDEPLPRIGAPTAVPAGPRPTCTLKLLRRGPCPPPLTSAPASRTG